jgi:hypothetical protein
VGPVFQVQSSPRQLQASHRPPRTSRQSFSR